MRELDYFPICVVLPFFWFWLCEQPQHFKGRLGLWFCRMGWHGEREYLHIHGINVTVRCARCGHVGILDSQGGF
jgi:hypothetical protein